MALLEFGMSNSESRKKRDLKFENFDFGFEELHFRNIHPEGNKHPFRIQKHFINFDIYFHLN